METLQQKEQTGAVQEETLTPSPSALPLPDEITPLEVIQEFVAAANSGSIDRELSNDCVLSYFGRHSRGATAAAGYFRVFVASRFQHEGFEEATFVSHAKVDMLKVRFMRSFSRARRRMIEEQNVRERATSLHLRAESDDEDERQPSRCTAQYATPPRPASQDLDQVKFAEAKGVLKSLSADYSDEGFDFGNARRLRLTLGYRLVPLSFGNRRHTIDICLVLYEKYSVATSSVRVPRRGSAARCNPPTDDEAEDEPYTRRDARRTLFVELPNEDKPEAPEADDQHAEQEQQQALEEQTLEHPPARVEATTQEESAQLSAIEEPPAPSLSSFTPRKRHIETSGGEVKPKRTPRLNRLRF